MTFNELPSPDSRVPLAKRSEFLLFTFYHPVGPTKTMRKSKVQNKLLRGSKTILGLRAL